MTQWFKQLNLVQRYSLAALMVMLLAMLLVAWWVGREIKANVIQRVAGDSALFVENFVAAPLQEMATQDFLSEDSVRKIEPLLSESSLGSEIVVFKIWSLNGKVVYGDRQGEILPVADDLEEALDGKVHSAITNLDDAENKNLKSSYGQLLEIYVPIRLERSDRVVAVVEFYQTVNELQRTVAVAQRQSWLVVALIMLSAYALLVGIVAQGHRLIVKQKDELNHQVRTLHSLLSQNEELTERLRRASLKTAAHNERFLSRVSADLDEGPAQNLGLSLAQLETLNTVPRDKQQSVLEAVYHSLSKAAQDIRHISSGLRLPELEALSISETLDRVVRDFERRTRSFVEVKAGNLPRQVMLPIKVTLFRLIQEGLSNAHRHADGAAQQVFVQMMTREKLLVEVRGQGPGFDEKQPQQGANLGLLGMRERIESVGGTFAVHSHVGQGTTLRAEIPLNGELYEQPAQ
jgi:signal transduction histidine kinase